MEALRHGKKEAEARVETLTEELEQAKVSLLPLT